MNNIRNEMAVQSYCFRNFTDNAKVANLVKEVGLKKIELCGVHVDFNDPSGFDRVIDTYQQNDIDIVSIGVVQLSEERRDIETYFEFASKAGLKNISISFNPDRMDKVLELAGEMAEEYDLYLGIHNHGGHHWLGNSEMLRNVFSKSSKRIGLCLDTAWALDAGEDPVAMADEFFDRLYAVHFKDFIFNQAGIPDDVIVGSGNLELKRFMDLLEEKDYQGITILEYEGDVSDPVPSLKKCVESMERIMY